jgi:hypothetical protein
MPTVGDKIVSQAALVPIPAIQDEKLFLPSDLTAVERRDLDVIALGVEESRWREGEAFDSLRAIQNLVKTLTALGDRKRKQDRKQKQNTRAGEQISEITRRRDLRIDSYEASRQAMISLEYVAGESKFPRLTAQDLVMKSVRQKRQVGDSQRTDGRLFRAPGIMQPSGSTASSSVQQTLASPGEIMNITHIY